MDAAASCVSLLLWLLLAAASVLPSSALKLPSYIKPCYKNDPNLNDCALKHVQEAIPSMLNGDQKYNIPALNPLKVTQIKVNRGDGSVGLGITLNDVDFYGFNVAVLKEINLDLSKNQAVIKAIVPVGQMLAKYEMNGKILLLPIKGSGNANITLVDLDLAITLQWKLEKRDDGKEYIKPVLSDIKYDMSHAYIRLDNLFGGDKLLGDSMNQLLNENWKDVVQEMGPALVEALSEVVIQVLSGIAQTVPYDEIFPETV